MCYPVNMLTKTDIYTNYIKFINIVTKFITDSLVTYNDCKFKKCKYGNNDESVKLCWQFTLEKFWINKKTNWRKAILWKAIFFDILLNYMTDGLFGNVWAILEGILKGEGTKKYLFPKYVLFVSVCHVLCYPRCTLNHSNQLK